MNAPFALTAEYVRTADLRQPDEVARIEGFVAEYGGGLFHRQQPRGTMKQAAAQVGDETPNPRRFVGLAKVGGTDAFARESERGVHAKAPPKAPAAAVSASIRAASR